MSKNIQSIKAKLKNMLESKIISSEEYNEFIEKFKEKYSPKISGLFFEKAQ